MLDIEVTATDGSDASVTEMFLLTVNDDGVGEPPEVSNPIADQVATEDSAFTFVVPGMHSAIRTQATV